LCPSFSAYLLIFKIFFLGRQQGDGGIVAHVHLLKDTGSGGQQHPLCTYKGTSSTAKGEQGITLSSVTTDGDMEIASIVTAVSPKANVMVNRDPNHYAKGLAKHVTNLCHEHPVLNVVVASLKAHFLVGMYYFPSPLFVLTTPTLALMPLPSCAHPTPLLHTGIKKFKKNELGFTTHMRAFIPHIMDQHHCWCSHSTWPPKVPKVLTFTLVPSCLRP
jgi:hypothetical protein